MGNSNFLSGNARGKICPYDTAAFTQTKKGAVNFSQFQVKLNSCHNTSAPCFRQILIMPVSLYTVRVAPATSGAEDQGIATTGIAVLFSFLNGTMTGTAQRFLNHIPDKNNTEEARNSSVSS
jgi:hypothetical protein